MSSQKLSRFQLEILYVVVTKYEPDISAIQEDYEQWYNTDIIYQTVYQALERLEEYGHVEKHSIDGRANCYIPKTAGLEVVEEHRSFVTEHAERVERSP